MVHLWRKVHRNVAAASRILLIFYIALTKENQKYMFGSFFWLVLVGAKNYNQTSALQKRWRSKQQMYHHSQNSRRVSYTQTSVAITTFASNEWGVGWSKIFTKCALANIHLVRDYYHLPTYRNISKRGDMHTSV